MSFVLKKLNDLERNLFEKAWIGVQKELRNEVGAVAFKSWLSQLNPLGLSANKVLYLSLPSLFLIDWVNPHYGNKIEILFDQNFSK